MGLTGLLAEVAIKQCPHNHHRTRYFSSQEERSETAAG